MIQATNKICGASRSIEPQSTIVIAQGPSKAIQNVEQRGSVENRITNSSVRELEKRNAGNSDEVEIAMRGERLSKFNTRCDFLNKPSRPAFLKKSRTMRARGRAFPQITFKWPLESGQGKRVRMDGPKESAMSNGQSGWISGARRALLKSDENFFQVRPFRYWFDFLTSAAFAYIAATGYLMAPLFSWMQIISFPLAVFWLYRLGSLVHEVAHLQHAEMRGFKVAWNLIVGVMTLAPSPFFTRHHRDHHSHRLYGTPQDPEYVANVCRPGTWQGVLWYSCKILLFPLAVFLRFLLSPLSFLHPRLREFVLRRGSSLTMNWRYERKLNAFDRWAITSVELLCWVRATMIPMAVLLGMTSWTRVPQLYLLAVATLALNQMRLLADHQLHSDGQQLDMDAHLQDSCNYTQRDFLTWLFFPFAIRYHALHHLFPTLPYHNLSSAHRYLSHHLPADSAYHSLEHPGWWSVAQKFFVFAKAKRET